MPLETKICAKKSAFLEILAATLTHDTNLTNLGQVLKMNYLSIRRISFTTIIH